MRWLIFLSRVAFLSGVMIILAISLLIFNWNNDEAISSAIISAGYVFGFIMIPLINVVYLLLAAVGKPIGEWVPRWLIVFNISCLAILVLYFVYINGYFNFKG